MNRRFFLAAAATTLALPLRATAAEHNFYEPGLAEEALAEGKVVFLDFWTNWCSTCAAQNRIISELRDSTPAYDEAITFFTVDWDVHAKGDLARGLNIPRRSTLVVLKGDQELGRIVAGTSRKDIKALMDVALAAAQS